MIVTVGLVRWWTTAPQNETKAKERKGDWKRNIRYICIINQINSALVMFYNKFFDESTAKAQFISYGLLLFFLAN